MKKQARKPITPRQRAAQRVGKLLDQRERLLAEIDERCKAREAVERKVMALLETWKCDQVAHGGRVFRVSRPRTDRPKRLYEARSACDGAMVAPATGQ